MKNIILIICVLLCMTGAAQAEEFPYWIEGESYVYIPVDVTDTKTIYIEKELGQAPSGASVFEFYDDFSDGNYDGWTVLGGTWSVTDGVLKQTEASTGHRYIKSPYSYSGDYIVDFTPSGNVYYSFQLQDQNNNFMCDADLGKIYRRASGTFTQMGVLTNYNHWEVSVSGGSTTLSNGVSTLSSSQFTSGYIGLDAYNTNTGISDIRVRQKVATAPTVTVTETEDFYTVVIENNIGTALSGYQVRIPASELDISSSTESLYISDIDPTSPEAAVSPVAGFTLSPELGSVPFYVKFTDVSSNTPTGWLWEFGDGSTSTEQSPSHTYTEPGVFTVTLTVTNSAGSDDVARTVRAYIPSAPSDKEPWLVGFIESGWFILLVMMATFAYFGSMMIPGYPGIAGGAIVGLISMFVMKTVSEGMILFTLFAVLFIIAAVKKHKGG